METGSAAQWEFPNIANVSDEQEIIRVHSTQGKPEKSGKYLEKLKNQGQHGKLRKILWKSKHSGKTQGTYLHFFSTCWYYTIV